MPHNSPRRVHPRVRLRAVFATLAAGCCLAAPGAAIAAPTATIVAHPDPGANDEYARFDFTSDTDATFECRLASESFAPCGSPKYYSDATMNAVSDGPHTFYVRAKDKVTGALGIPDSYTWTAEPLNGMGMGLNYVNRGKYIWITDFGANSTRQLLGDVTGDGRDDAVAFFKDRDNGRWEVARSNPRNPADSTSPGDGFVRASAAPLTGLGGAIPDNDPNTPDSPGVKDAFLDDVDGDNDDDLVAVMPNGNWRVALSQWKLAGGASGPGGFALQPSAWAIDYGTTATRRMLADASGDGRADAIVYAAGTWKVRASTGSSFNVASDWKQNFGVGSTHQFAADVTGDTTADAIIADMQSGEWKVAPSCGWGVPQGSCLTGWGPYFGTVAPWLSDFGNYTSPENGVTYPSTPMVGDVGALDGPDGDRKADAVRYHEMHPLPDPHNQRRWVWERAPSNGTSFQKQKIWKNGHERHLDVDGLTGTLLLGNVDGWMRDQSPTRETYGPTDDPVIFEDSIGPDLMGRWKFLPGEGKSDDPEYVREGAKPTFTLLGEKYRPSAPDKWNRWEADAKGPDPIMSLDLQGWRPVGESDAERAYPKNFYDSFDAGVLDGQLKKAKAAHIDFFVIDQTNDVNTGGAYVWNRGIKLCQRVKELRKTDPRIPRIAAAVGGFGTGSPTGVVSDARQTYDDLAHNAQCGATDPVRGLSSGYMQIRGKPLLALYLEPDKKQAFIDADSPVTDGMKPYDYVKSLFTIRWYQGGVESDPPAGKADNFPADFYNYFGTVWWDGSIPDRRGMGVMAGWKRQYPGDDRYLPRQLGNTPSDQFYVICGWRRVVAQKPRPDVVVVTGYNGYGEQTAVVPTKAPASAGWYDNPNQPGWYWNQTAYWANERKLGSDGGFPTAPTDSRCKH